MELVGGEMELRLEIFVYVLYVTMHMILSGKKFTLLCTNILWIGHYSIAHDYVGARLTVNGDIWSSS
jgi:hypothetical protein